MRGRLRTKAVLARLAEQGFHVERNRLWRLSDGLRLVTRTDPTDRVEARSWSDDQAEVILITLQLRQSRGFRPDFVYELAITTGGTPDPLVDRLRALYSQILAQQLGPVATLSAA